MPAHEVRIIGGAWKRSRLPVLDRPGLRPTPDRVRETLFNWLGQDLRGWRALDAFAGSGALGFEAASRGATAVVMLERDERILQSLQATKVRLGAANVELVRTDALTWMRRGDPEAAAKFDVVFLDPPFGDDHFVAAVLATERIICEQGLIYLEADRAFDDAMLLPHGWRVLRHLRAGAVHAHLLVRIPRAEAGTAQFDLIDDSVRRLT